MVEQQGGGALVVVGCQCCELAVRAVLNDTDTVRVQYENFVVYVVFCTFFLQFRPLTSRNLCSTVLYSIEYCATLFLRSARTSSGMPIFTRCSRSCCTTMTEVAGAPRRPLGPAIIMLLALSYASSFRSSVSFLALRQSLKTCSCTVSPRSTTLTSSRTRNAASSATTTSSARHAARTLALAAVVGGAAASASGGRMNGRAACAPPSIFPIECLQYDHYSGVTIDLERWSSSSQDPTTATDSNSERDEFADLLAASLQQWKQEQRKGIWIRVPSSHSDAVQAAVRQGFEFHMVVDGKVLVLTKWLDESTPSRLPLGPTHQIGVGCLVFHPRDPNQMLVVQEKSGPAAAFDLWKMPTGLADPGEDIHQAAIRELAEETGLKATFRGILTFRQAHSTPQGSVVGRANSDLFFVCVLQLDETEDGSVEHFQACPAEIAAIQWMPVESYCDQVRWQSSPVYLEMNQAIRDASRQTLFESQTLPLGFAGGTNTLYKSQFSTSPGGSD